ncbi:MAG TPA: cytochrome P450 [Kineosporiaceae bacterium]
MTGAPEKVTECPAADGDLPAPFGRASTCSPWAEYARMRSEGGITRVELRPGLRPWVVTGYRLARAVLGDPRMTTDAGRTTDEVRAAILAGRPEERLNLIGRNLLTVGGADHERLRRLVSSALSAQRVAGMESWIRGSADRLLDGLAGREVIDLLGDYTVPLAVEVVCRLIGIPEEQHGQFSDWGRALIRDECHSPEAFEAVCTDMLDRFLPVLDDRLADSKDDLLSLLAKARHEGRVDDYELISITYQLFFAGHETTAHFIANAILVLLNHPVERAAAVADPQVLAATVEELLRLEGSVKVTVWRFPTAPVDIGDQTIMPGEPVLTVLSSANRDEEVIPEAERFLPGRRSATHLAFGYGSHHCLGAPLGRLEARIGLGRLLTRFPQLALAEPGREPNWRLNLLMRGVTDLPVRLGPPSDGI